MANTEDFALASDNAVFSNYFLTDVRIEVYTLEHRPQEAVLRKNRRASLEWTFLRHDHVKRWKWYFKYRAALLQVRYPKATVELRYETSDMQSQPQFKEILRNKIVAKKRKITYCDNKMEEFRKNQGLFSIEDDPRYVPTMNKIQELRQELLAMEEEYKSL